MDPDLLLAIKLQEEFNREENKKQDKMKTPTSIRTSNSIVSPQWEINDPNPDIFNLFQVFDAKFFWNKLGCVEVKWSNRMYSCAGTTTYKGLRGCIVTLSLPLLKLRPRKDLIETLLHEMIHAYLFVADRNKEREEHGPKFHSHMNRINQAAGTHITVYHSFHDEVNHYKTHWWRCNGSCRFQRPYFGLVKRSSNRAPGPNDFWFEKHQLSCGGQFIKVKEPEGFKSRKSKKVQAEKENTGKSKNLDNFLSPVQPFKSTNFSNGSTNNLKGINKNKSAGEKFGKTNSASGPKGLLSASGKQQNLDRFLSPTQPSTSKTTSNFGTMNEIKGIDSNKATVEKLSKVNNIHGFEGLSTPTGRTNSNSFGRKFGNNGGTALLSNKSGTLVEKPRAGPSTTTANNNNKKTTQQSSVSPKKPMQSFSGSGQVLDPNCKPSDINRANSRLLKLFPVKESTSSTELKNNPAKKPKLEVTDSSISLLDESDNEKLVNCPVCNQQLKEKDVNNHLDVCMNLEAVMQSINETIIIEDDDDDDEVVDETVHQNSKNVNCPVCDYKCSVENINQHLDECLQKD